MTVKIDENEVFRIIEDRRPKVVLVNAPGGLLRQTKELMERVKERYGVTAIMSGDSCYGICDTVDGDVEKLQADLALHIGHNAATTPMSGSSIVRCIIPFTRLKTLHLTMSPDLTGVVLLAPLPPPESPLRESMPEKSL